MGTHFDYRLLLILAIAVAAILVLLGPVLFIVQFPPAGISAFGMLARIVIPFLQLYASILLLIAICAYVMWRLGPLTSFAKDTDDLIDLVLRVSIPVFVVAAGYVMFTNAVLSEAVPLFFVQLAKSFMFWDVYKLYQHASGEASQRAMQSDFGLADADASAVVNFEPGAYGMEDICGFRPEMFVISEDGTLSDVLEIRGGSMTALDGFRAYGSVCTAVFPAISGSAGVGMVISFSSTPEGSIANCNKKIREINWQQLELERLRQPN